MDDIPKEVFERLVHDSVTRCRAVSNRSAALSHAEFSGSTPRSLAELIGRIADTLRDQLERLTPLFDTDRSHVLQMVRLIDSFVRDLGAHLRYVDGATTSKIPWSIADALDLLVKKYLPHKTFLLRPQWKYNYSIFLDDWYSLYDAELRPLVSAAARKKCLAGYSAGCHLLSFPSIERLNALLHCDLGHEIGHLVADLYLEQERTDYAARFRGTIAKRIGVGASDIDLEVGKQLQHAINLRRRGLEEIISDIFAVRALGPGALFALQAFAMQESLDVLPERSSSYYPPWRTRLRYSLDTLQTYGLGVPRAGDRGKRRARVNRVNSALQCALDNVRVMTEDETDRGVLASDWMVSLAYQSIAKEIPRVHKFLDKRYREAFMQPVTIHVEAVELVARIGEGVPPNELRTKWGARPASFEAILNAGWLYRIAYLGENATPLHVRDADTLNRLTLKALEYSALQMRHDAWLNASTESS